MKLVLLILIGLLSISLVNAMPIVNLNKTTSQVTYVINAIPTVKLIGNGTQGITANLSNLSAYVLKTGDTMTGNLILPKLIIENSSNIGISMGPLRNFWLYLSLFSTGIYYDGDNAWLSLYTLLGIDYLHISNLEFWSLVPINATAGIITPSIVSETGTININSELEMPTHSINAFGYTLNGGILSDISGILSYGSTIYPTLSDAYDIGSDDLRWYNAWFTNINFSNKIGALNMPSAYNTIIPISNNTQNLGSISSLWSKLFLNNLTCSNCITPSLIKPSSITAAQMAVDSIGTSQISDGQVFPQDLKQNKANWTFNGNMSYYSNVTGTTNAYLCINLGTGRIYPSSVACV